MDDVQNEDQVPVEPAESATKVSDPAADLSREEVRRLRTNYRLKQIHEYRMDKRDSPNPRTVVLRNISADLMDSEANIAEALRDLMTTTALTLEDIDEYSRSIDLMVRLAKQATQTSQFESRSSRCEK